MQFLVIAKVSQLNLKESCPQKYNWRGTIIAILLAFSLIISKILTPENFTMVSLIV